MVNPSGPLLFASPLAVDEAELVDGVGDFGRFLKAETVRLLRKDARLEPTLAREVDEVPTAVL